MPPDSFREYHSRATGDERIARLPAASLRYASLGSSRINQALRNVLGRAVVNGCPDAVGTDSRLSLALVEAHDSALAEAARNGLSREVLAHELEVEEKDGVASI